MTDAKPGFQIATQGRVLGRQQGGRIVQRLRESPSQPGRQRGRRAERDAGLAEPVVERAKRHAARRRFVREHDVESVHRELGEQRVALPLAADDVRGRQGESGLQDLEGDQLRERIDDAHEQAHGAGGGPLLDSVLLNLETTPYTAPHGAGMFARSPLRMVR